MSMPEPIHLVVLCLVGMVAGGVGGVVGFGSAILLLPACNAVFGAEPSVGILTIAALIGNLSRVALWYRQVEWVVVWRYWLGGIPLAIAGSFCLSKIDSRLLPALFGGFILALIPVRRWLERRERRMPLSLFPALGAIMGFLSAVVSTTGPLNAPAFLSYGLIRGAYLSTEALSTAGIHLTKSLAYRRFELLSADGIVVGLALGGCMLIGTVLVKPLVERLEPRRFVLVVEVLLANSGLAMIAQAIWP